MLPLMIFPSRMLHISTEIIFIVDIGHQTEVILEIAEEVKCLVLAAHIYVTQRKEDAAIVIENFLYCNIAERGPDRVLFRLAKLYSFALSQRYGHAHIAADVAY